MNLIKAIIGLVKTNIQKASDDCMKIWGHPVKSYFPLYVDVRVVDIIHKIRLGRNNVAVVLDSLLLSYMENSEIVLPLRGDSFKRTSFIYKRMVGIPTNHDVRVKLYWLRNDAEANEIISDLFLIYAANNYKIPE